MTEIEARALALVNEIECERCEKELTRRIMRHDLPSHEALCRTLEQHEAFKQEVSDAVEGYLDGPPIERHLIIDTLRNFIIIPKPKPDPLVEIISEIEDGTYGETKDEYANKFRAALEARGLEIREKGQ
jgi:hypothetical protein